MSSLIIVLVSKKLFAIHIRAASLRGMFVQRERRRGGGDRKGDEGEMEGIRGEINLEEGWRRKRERRAERSSNNISTQN